MTGAGPRSVERAPSSGLPDWTPPEPGAWEVAREALPPLSDPPWPSASEYLADVAARLQRWLAGWIEGALPPWLASETLWLGIVYGIAGAVLLGLAGLVVRWVRKGRRARPGAVSGADVGPAPADEGVPGPAAWEERFRGAASRGAWRDALEALWWWGATTAAPSGLSSAWTTERLLRAAGRPELTGPYRELDGLRYGRQVPDRDRVLGLEGRLREVLP